jgi:Leucine-rich repeat (LRR) protein
LFLPSTKLLANFSFSRRLSSLTLIPEVSSEYYEFNKLDDGPLFNYTGKKEYSARNLICKNSSKPKENMNFLVNLTNLETIDARSCGIKNINYDIHIIAGKTGLYLNSLHRADFSHNKIESIEKNRFYSLKNGLKTLNLSNNVIENFATEAFYNLKNLENLDLSNNNITHINPTSFKDLKQLKEFNLANNHLQILYFELFSNSGKLQIMNFASNQIDEFNFATSVWRSMITLDLSNNKIFLMDPYIKSYRFPNLKNLILSKTTKKPNILPTPTNQPNDTKQKANETTTEHDALIKKSERTAIFLYLYITIITTLILFIVFQLYCTSKRANNSQHKSQPTTTNVDQVEINPIYSHMDEI